jgi:hypothetical protein
MCPEGLGLGADPVQRLPTQLHALLQARVREPRAGVPPENVVLAEIVAC